jgi:hypothetical protein
MEQRHAASQAAEIQLGKWKNAVLRFRPVAVVAVNRKITEQTFRFR